MRRVLLLFVVLVLICGVPGLAIAKKPTIMKGCLACHQQEEGVLRGKLVSHSEKFMSVKIDVGGLIWIVPYDSALLLTGARSLGEIPKDKEIAITYSGGEKSPKAAAIRVKQPYKLPDEKVMSLEELKAIVAKGAKSGATIVDSRPLDAYASGYIPGAKNLPYPAFDKKHASVLPKDRNAPVVFYCGGFS